MCSSTRWRAWRDPGTRIVGETLDPYQTTKPEHLGYHEENRRLGRLEGQLRLRVRHLRLATPWWDYLFCTPQELEAVIALTRWELVDAHMGRTGVAGFRRLGVLAGGAVGGLHEIA